MKKIGIVGGMAWTSTVDYYSGICRRCEQWHHARNPGVLAPMPEIAIESLDLKTAFSYLGEDENEQSWERFDDYHRRALKRLEASGADFAIMAANSPHHRFTTITQGIKIPVINVLDVVAKVSSQAAAREVLILGTALAMRSAKFREAFSNYGIAAAGPDDDTARSTTAALVSELQLGKLQGAAERVGTLPALVSAEHSVEGVLCISLALSSC